MTLKGQFQLGPLRCVPSDYKDRDERSGLVEGCVYWAILLLPDCRIRMPEVLGWNVLCRENRAERVDLYLAYSKSRIEKVTRACKID
jgi:hypothetical protein